MNAAPKVRFAIDRGGTFTDVYAEYGGSEPLVIKLLSEDPQNYDDAPREGIRRALEIITGRSMPASCLLTDPIDYVRMGTTVATNALLERKGESTALVITRGFGDLLQIGYQDRPDIFDLKISKPALLYKEVLEIKERVRPAAQGDDPLELKRGINGEMFKILQAPDQDEIRTGLKRLQKIGINSLAIVFMHSYAFPDHEQLVEEIARELGFRQVSMSSEVMPMVKIVPRGDTTVADAYLTPCIKRYIHGFQDGFAAPLDRGNLHFMQSHGGLSPAHNFRGSNAVLSGPAGGVVGFAMTGRQALGNKPLIGFDMGGTSTDVSRFADDYELVHERQIAGVRIQAPQLAINTVAAGGGSRLFFKNGMLVVGPESAGSHPGPVCYRKNGQLAITDANLLLGRLQPEFFPAIFGPWEDQPLDRTGAEKTFAALTTQINNYYAATGRPAMLAAEVAAGFIEVANQTMARAIREISVMRGYDVKEHVLVSFGGAGGQHACAIARLLSISEILVPRFAGVLSAYGMGLADVVVERQEPAALVFGPEQLSAIEASLARLAKAAEKELIDQGFKAGQITVHRYLNMRFAGTDTNFMIKIDDEPDIAAAFRARHQREFSFDLPNRQIIVDDIRVRACGRTGQGSRPTIPAHDGRQAVPAKVVSCYFNAKWLPTPIFMHEDLRPDCRVSGPALIISPTSTIVLEPDCRLRINQFGDIRISIAPPATQEISGRLDPAQLSVFSNLFMSIAEQMGRTLQRTATSTNIKERLDYSCAIFDQQGRLVANAPHIPVHLGAMDAAVREQVRLRSTDLAPGDVLMSNHPAAGGSHLPDITVITPVWLDGEIIFFTASRGHHADIGGLTPGSMPPFSTKLSDEGIRIKSFKLVNRGNFQEAEAREVLTQSRKIEDNISDLKAQVAANQRGIELLLAMVEHYSLHTVLSYMGHIQDCAARAVRDILKAIAARHGRRECHLEAVDYMDDGTPLALRLSISPDGKATFDFTGTGPQVEGNWNIPTAVVYSVIIYCLQCLADSGLPLNHGCLEPITVHIPIGSLLSPAPEAAVAGGNVLTSQRLTDVILKAFGAAAASQGCMNNITFGNNSFGYYETIGGGAGAGPDWHGQSGVHTHMTNTRITDPEILEKRYPVMLKQFAIRKASGGAGKFKGGDGLVREYEAFDQLQMAILTERRVRAPFGLHGGQDGLPGCNLYIKKDKTVIDLGGKNEITIQPGERLKILTPGGGGYGTG